MRIIQLSLDENTIFDKPICACIGYFDGIHKGHKKLVDKTIEAASIFNAEASLITFNKDPKELINNLENIQHISTMKQRISLAVKYGIKNIIILNFDKKMLNLAPIEFIEKVLLKLNIKKLICGFDFRYGFNGQGNSDTLLNNPYFEVSIVDSVNTDGKKVSTSRIIQNILNYKIEKANQLLGYNYCVEGIVIKGEGKGTTIGFPTANIKVDSEYYIPSKGVYAGFVYIGNLKYKAIINIGHNPTFNYTENISIEVHILDFNKDIYGKNIRLEFSNFLRKEVKFKSIDNLILQLEQDLNKARKIL